MLLCPLAQSASGSPFPSLSPMSGTNNLAFSAYCRSSIETCWRAYLHFFEGVFASPSPVRLARLRLWRDETYDKLSCTRHSPSITPFVDWIRAYQDQTWSWLYNLYFAFTERCENSRNTMRVDRPLLPTTSCWSKSRKKRHLQLVKVYGARTLHAAYTTRIRDMIRTRRRYAQQHALNTASKYSSSGNCLYCTSHCGWKQHFL